MHLGPYFLKATVEWTGVRLSTILNMAGASKNAIKVITYGADGYTSDLPIWKAMDA
jgi:Oxidoreductase molybdopterin binding domain.